MNDRHQLFLGLFVFTLTLALGVWQWSELQGMKEQTQALQSEASNLTSFSEELADEYKVIKVDVTAAREETEQALSEVFPVGENLTALTRLFDDYAVKNNFESNPFFISSIQYSTENPDASAATYRSLTLNLNATASKKNLSKFLEMVENSGSLEASDRLMSVQGLTISYPDEYGGTYALKAELQAYYTSAL
ncbi:hypothetical protein IPG41_06205 [Candidatus Peregrinibacteria bacterium]|nr:MAG: hypothetical protein IPG41_06205 [Candidatus Peregrinibacteria bacterium]